MKEIDNYKRESYNVKESKKKIQKRKELNRTK